MIMKLVMLRIFVWREVHEIEIWQRESANESEEKSEAISSVSLRVNVINSLSLMRISL